MFEVTVLWIGIVVPNVPLLVPCDVTTVVTLLPVACEEVVTVPATVSAVFVAVATDVLPVTGTSVDTKVVLDSKPVI